MQLIKPKQWINSQTIGIGITTANQEAIASTLDIQNSDDLKERITTSLPKFKSIDYSFCFPYLYQNKPLDKSTLSQSILFRQPFIYDKQLFKKRSTLAPWQSLTKPVYDQITQKSGIQSIYIKK